MPVEKQTEAGRRKQAAEEKPRFVRSEDFPTFYSNNVYVTTNPWDLQIIFGAICPPLLESPGKKPAIEQQVRVVMSYQHAKAMLDAIKGLIEKYEAAMGEVKYPKKAAD